MAIEVTPLHPTLGAEVGRVDLTRPVPPEIFAEIEAAFDRHGILVFPEQPVTDEQQLAFSRRFGPLVLLSHKIRHRVFVYLSGRKMWYLDLSFSGSGDRNGRRVE
jgi:alpha-ketoglutarate-dependent taurine dioxygenase